MTRRQRILAVVGALALIGATLSTSVGHRDDGVDTSSVTILPGPLVATLTWTSFEKRFACTGTEGQNGYLVLRVLDERGYATGWNVSMSAADSSGSNHQSGNSHLALVPGAVSAVRGNPDLAGHATFGIDPLRTSPSLLWTVPNVSGDGEYELPLVSAPGLPGVQCLSDLYTIVVNIGGGAP